MNIIANLSGYDIVVDSRMPNIAGASVRGYVMDIIYLMNNGGLSKGPVMLSTDDAQRLALELAPAPKVAQPQPHASVRCPDCNGSGQYIGIGFAPAEACRLCNGAGKVAASGTSPAPVSERERGFSLGLEQALADARRRFPGQSYSSLVEHTRKVAEQAAALAFDREMERAVARSVTGVMTLPNGATQELTAHETWQMLKLAWGLHR